MTRTPLVVEEVRLVALLLTLPPGYRFSIFTQILPTPKVSITQGVIMLRSPLEYMLAGLRSAHTNNGSWFFGTL